MTHRERFLSALSGGSPTPPPAAPLYLGLYLEQFRRRFLAEVYAEMAGAAESLTLSADQELEARVEALARALGVFRQPPAWVPVPLGPGRASIDGCRITFPPGQCLWHSPTGGAPVDYLAPHDDSYAPNWEDGEELPAVEQILAERPAWSAQAFIEGGSCDYPARAIRRFGQLYVPTAHLGTPYWHCYARLGFVGMMRAMRERPELMAAVASVDLERLLITARVLWHAGIRQLFIEECLSSSDLISEDDYLRFAFPGTRDLLAELRNIGFQTVYYFCGGIENRLPHLAALEADALAFEESKKGFIIDLGRIRREVGPDVLLFGNTDAVLLRDGSERTITADVARRHAEAGPRFVISIGSPATLDTDPAKLDMLMRAAL